MEEQRVLVITAVKEEKQAVLRGLNGDSRFYVVDGGVGSAAAAVSTAAVLAEGQYRMVVSAGIGGGFSDKAAVGSLVIANQVVAADLGAETETGFSSIEELGFGIMRLQPDLLLGGRLQQAIAASGSGLQVAQGSVLTVSTVTGTEQTAVRLQERIAGAASEAMEGFGVALAAARYKLPFLELRGISNVVGPRDRAAWRIDEGLLALEQGFHYLAEVWI